MNIPRACYVAGPMRGHPAFNFPTFFAAEARLLALGWVVFNPARMDVEAGCATEAGQWIAGDATVGDVRECAGRDLDVLVRTLRKEHGDAVVVLPGWEKSIGAAAEVAVARWVGLPVLPLEEVCR